MRATCGQRVQAMFGAPNQVAAQIGFGVVTGGAFESGEVGSYRQPQLIGYRHQVIGRDEGKVDESLHGRRCACFAPPRSPQPRRGKGVRPAASASQRAYGGLMADVLHHRYLPFTADQLGEHFARVHGPGDGDGDRDRHLGYYQASVEEARKYDELIRSGGKPTRAQTRLGRQMEKDERFWLATALMSLYHADGGSGRGELFARLLERAGLRRPPGFPRWEDALAGALDLFFEVNLPSPARYRAWLRDHLGERAPIPYLKKQAEAPGARLEGATKADAMLLAPSTGVAVIFEAKVLSDISTHVTFDLARNQLARSIDVMLEGNSALAAPLSLRKPERTLPGAVDTRAHAARARRRRDQ